MDLITKNCFPFPDENLKSVTVDKLKKDNREENSEGMSGFTNIYSILVVFYAG